jgi:hypothetical protein
MSYHFVVSELQVLLLLSTLYSCISSHSYRMDEDEELQKVLALSLVTAREDEIRRKQLYSSVESINRQETNNLNQDRLSASNSMPDFMVTANIPKQPSSAQATSTIPRPRPQGKGGGLQLTLPGPPKVPPRPEPFEGPSVPPRPKPSPSHHPQSISPTPIAMKLPPPQSSVRNRPGAILHDDKRSSSMPPPSNRPQAEVLRGQPSASLTSSPQRQIVINHPPGNSSDLILLSPPSAQKNPFNFSLDHFDPLRQKQEHQMDPKPEVTPPSSLMPPTSMSRKVSEPNMSMNNPTYGMYLPSKPLVPPRPHSVSDQPVPPSFHASTLPKPSAVKPRTSDPGTSDLPPRPSKDLYSCYSSLPRIPKDNPDPTPSAAESSSELECFLQQRADASPSDEDAANLMDFNDGMENLSLESFDPLFSLSIKESSLSPVEETKAQEPMLETPTKTSASIQPEEELKNTEEAMLQDPFSVSDLTQALERKRQQHAEVMRKKLEEEEKEKAAEEKKMLEKEKMAKEENTQATHVHKRSLSKGSSFMVKGQVRIIICPLIILHVIIVCHFQQLAYEMLQVYHETADEEISSFCQMVARLVIKDFALFFLCIMLFI